MRCACPLEGHCHSIPQKLVRQKGEGGTEKEKEGRAAMGNYFWGDTVLFRLE